jgi:hypothetical protein
MVSTTKRTSKKTKKAQQKAPLKRPDLERGIKAAERVIRENVDWLKEMAKR